MKVEMVPVTDSTYCPDNVRNDTLYERTLCDFYLLRFSGPTDDPRFGFFPRFIQGQKTCFSPSLDELIGFHHELGTKHPTGELIIGGDGVGRGIPRNLGDSCLGVYECCFGLGGGRDWRGTFEPVLQEEFSVEFADSCEWVMLAVSFFYFTLLFERYEGLQTF